MSKIDEHHHPHDNGQPHQHGTNAKSAFKPSLQAIFSNWQRSREPFVVKIGMAIRNNWIKIRRGSSCCGHHGEVGC